LICRFDGHLKLSKTARQERKIQQFDIKEGEIGREVPVAAHGRRDDKTIGVYFPCLDRLGEGELNKEAIAGFNTNSKDFVFTATYDKDLSIPARCSFIHYEISMPCFNDDGSVGDQYAIGMLLWCSNIYTGEPICWSSSQSSLKHSKSCYSSLCDWGRRNEPVPLLPLRRYQSENVVRTTENTYDHADLGATALAEAIALSRLPRSISSALTVSNQAVAVIEGRSPFRTVRVNPTWADLFGYEEEGMAISRVISILQGGPADSNRLEILHEALSKGWDVSIMLTNYKVARRLRMVPLSKQIPPSPDLPLPGLTLAALDMPGPEKL